MCASQDEQLKAVTFPDEEILNKHAPRNFLDPISLELMNDPVVCGTFVPNDADTDAYPRPACAHTDATPDPPVTINATASADGNTYDRASIEGWFNAGHKTSPLTGLELEMTNLFPCISE